MAETVSTELLQEISPERYAMGLLAEEAGEVLQWAGKSLRFGFDTPGRKDASGHVTGETPRDLMPPELGDFLAAMDFAVAHGFIDAEVVQAARAKKLAKLLDPSSLDNLGRPLAPQPPRRSAKPAGADSLVDRLRQMRSALAKFAPKEDINAAPDLWDLLGSAEIAVESAAARIQADAATIASLTAKLAEVDNERDVALEAEAEAKDCFWAVYPTYVEVVGHGISTEAARTDLSRRAEAAEAALSDARKTVIEEAAKVADRISDEDGDKAARGFWTEAERTRRLTGRDIATAIRQLSEAENG